MKKKQKIIAWVFIFTLLTGFTGAMGFGLIHNTTKVALAAMIDENPNTVTSKFIEFNSADFNNGNSENSSGVNGHHGNKHYICEVGQTQFDYLSATYGATLHNVNVRGHNVPVVTIHSQTLTQQIIKDYLNSSGNQNPNCFVPQFFSWFFLIFNANLS